MFLRRSVVLATCLLASACSASNETAGTEAKSTSSAAPAASASASPDPVTGLIPTDGNTTVSRILDPRVDRKLEITNDVYSAQDAGEVLKRSDEYLREIYFKPNRFAPASVYALPDADLAAIKDIASPATYSRFIAAARRLDASERERVKALEAWRASGKDEADFKGPTPPKSLDKDVSILSSFVVLPGPKAYTYRQRRVNVYEGDSNDQNKDFRGRLIVHYVLRGTPSPHVYDLFMGWTRVKGTLKLDTVYWSIKSSKR